MQSSQQEEKKKQVDEVLRRLDDIEKKFQELFNAITVVEQGMHNTKDTTKSSVGDKVEEGPPAKTVVGDEILNKARELSEEIKKMAYILRSN